jgi:predicted RNA binding protein YcfA (HicA-like mRNA interferase family)
MPKLPVVKPREVLRALEKAGFLKIRSKGSHIQFKKWNLLVTVPIHDKDMKTETLKSILRQAKLSIEDFNKLL